MGKKLLVGCGGVMLMSVLLLAAFSLGVYAGRGDLLGGTAPPIAGPVQQPRQVQPAPQPVQPQPTPQPVQPQARPILVGRVRSVDPGGLVLATGEGLRHVVITPETRFRWAGQEGQLPTPASYEDVRPGVEVAIFGRPGENAQGPVANVVEILP